MSDTMIREMEELKIAPPLNSDVYLQATVRRYNSAIEDCLAIVKKYTQCVSDGRTSCIECGGSGRTSNHDMGEVECSSCEGSGILQCGSDCEIALGVIVKTQVLKGKDILVETISNGALKLFIPVNLAIGNKFLVGYKLEPVMEELDAPKV